MLHHKRLMVTCQGGEVLFLYNILDIIESCAFVVTGKSQFNTVKFIIGTCFFVTLIGYRLYSESMITYITRQKYIQYLRENIFNRSNIIYHKRWRHP